MTIQNITLNEERNVQLSCWIQKVEGEYGLKRRPALIVLPGGGYSMCSDREAEPVAAPFIRAGYQVFILRYSVGEHKAWPNPLSDYEQLMEMIVEKQDEWHVQTDKIAVVGFSAGGHLGACAATVSKHRPAAAILGYPGVSREIADMCQPGMPYPSECVDAKTPPCFVFSTRDDSTVPISGSLEFMQALAEKSIAFESHIYAYGPHGFATGDGYLAGGDLCRRAKGWVDDAIDWLQDIFGELTTSGHKPPVCQGKINGDAEEYLSVYCTLAHLSKQSQEVRSLLSELYTSLDTIAKERGLSSEGLLYALRNLRAIEALKAFKVPQATINAIDIALCATPNTCR